VKENVCENQETFEPNVQAKILKKMTKKKKFFIKFNFAKVKMEYLINFK
jgi:hypothetical protein